LRSALTKLARRRRGRLRPARFAPPVRPVVAEATAPAAQARWRDTVVTTALALAALLPPIVLLTRPQTLSLIGRVVAAVPLIGVLVLAPASVGWVAALRGLARIRDALRSAADSEPEYAVARVFIQAGLLAYAVGLATAGDEAAAAPCLVVGALGLISGWLMLLHVVLSPAPSAIRRHAAIIIDVGLFSAFLHFGADAAAALYPLYLVTIFYAGLRLGFGALIVAASAAIAGFVAVVATTPFWQQQPALVGGLGVALAALPAGMTLLVRALERSRADAAAANAARDRFVTIIGRGLRAPVEAMRLALPEAAADGEVPAWPAEPSFALPARALLSQISEVVDLAAIEAGDFAPSAEPFDLHALVNDTLDPLRAATAPRGIALTLRIDPAVPYRLHGWPRQIAQVLNSLVIAAISSQDAAPIRIEIGALVRPDAIVQLRLTVRGQHGAAGEADPLATDPLATDPLATAPLATDPLATDPLKSTASWAAQPRGDRLGLFVVRRLVELMGGRIDPAPAPDQGTRWSVMLPLALDESAPAAPLDLAQRPVLLVTEDSQFAGELAEPLNDWNADTRWIGGLDDALVYVDRFETPLCPILIVDGRSRVIAALSFVHRATLARDEPPLILFVADATQVASLGELGDGELTGLLAPPLTEPLLESALHALPLRQPPPPATLPTTVPSAAALPAAEAAAAVPETSEEDADDRVTPIAAHPRFAAGAASVVDVRIIGALRGLGGNGDFLPEVIDSFRIDARQIMERIAAAVAAADLAAFARGVHALRRCAATLGGARLCELLMSFRDIDVGELQQQGTSILQRLEAELARFEAALLDLPPRRGEMRV